MIFGRIKPLDTVARNSLLIIHGKQTLAAEHETLTAIDWLAEVMLKPNEADLRKIFVIRSPDTRAAIAGIDTRRLTRHLRDHGAVPGAFGTDETAVRAAAGGGVSATAATRWSTRRRCRYDACRHAPEQNRACRFTPSASAVPQCSQTIGKP